VPTDEDESSDHALDELTELTHTYPVSPVARSRTEFRLLHPQVLTIPPAVSALEYSLG
jgi:hypothetical protein